MSVVSACILCLSIMQKLYVKQGTTLHNATVPCCLRKCRRKEKLHERVYSFLLFFFLFFFLSPYWYIFLQPFVNVPAHLLKSDNIDLPLEPDFNQSSSKSCNQLIHIHLTFNFDIFWHSSATGVLTVGPEDQVDGSFLQSARCCWGDVGASLQQAGEGFFFTVH